MRQLFWLLILAAISRQAISDPVLQNYWKETGLKLSLLDDYISSQNCYTKKEFLFGCLLGLNEYLEFAEPRLEISYDRNSGLQLVESVRRKAPTREETKQRKEKVKKFIHGWTNHFEMGTNRIDFSQALAQARAKVTIPGDEEAYATSMVMREYLRWAEDAHSYLVPEAYIAGKTRKKEEAPPNIGISLLRKDGGYIIEQILEGSPAAGPEGLHEDDVLTHVNDRKIQTLRTSEIIKLLEGKAGSKAKLRVLREGKELEVEVKRQTVALTNVKSRMLDERRAGILYLQLEDFLTGEFVEDLEKHLRTAGDARGLILDLRGNGGGFLKKAVETANLFVQKGSQVVGVKDLHRMDELELGPFLFKFQPIHWYSNGQDPASTLPMVVLMDRYSASASEIVAGALQDQRRALIVGERSFGKGSVQKLFDFEKVPGVLISVTIASYELPTGRSIQWTGITPDIEVYRNPDPSDDDKFALREEDYFPNGLEAGGATVDPRNSAINQRIQQCLVNNGLANTRYVDGLRKTHRSDFQLFTAQDALVCMLEENLSL